MNILKLTKPNGLRQRRKKTDIPSLLSTLAVVVLGGFVMYFLVTCFSNVAHAEMTAATSWGTVAKARVSAGLPKIGKNKGKGNIKSMGKGLNDDVQVVLCLDASGSMDELFVEVSNSLDMLMDTLTSCRLNGKTARVNLGIVVYGQEQDNGAPRVLTPFSTDVASMRSKLKEIQCNGAVEPCGEVIDFALNNFGWNMRDRQDTLKVIFIAGNEDFKQGTLDYRTAMRNAKGKNIIVNTIYCYPGTEKEAAMTPEGKEWADAAALADGMGLVLSMVGSTARADDDIEQVISMVGPSPEADTGFYGKALRALRIQAQEKGIELKS